MTTTATQSYTDFNGSTEAEEKRAFRPFVSYKSTAGTEGVWSGELFNAPSSSMTYTHAPDPGVIYLALGRSAPEMSVKIIRLIVPQEHQPEPEMSEESVYAPPRKRHLVFSQQVQFRIGDLPQRKPRITPSMLTLEEDDAGTEEAE